MFLKYIHTYIHTYMHIYTHTHTHSHTHAGSRKALSLRNRKATAWPRHAAGNSPKQRPQPDHEAIAHTIQLAASGLLLHMDI